MKMGARNIFLLALVLFSAIVGVLGKRCTDPLCQCFVIRADITTEAEAQLVNDLGVDVWSHGSVAHVGTNDIMLCGRQQAMYLDSFNFTYSLMVPNVYDLHANQLKSGDSADWFSSYHTLPDIVTFAQGLAKNFSDLVTYVPSTGKSIEGRDIFLFKITNGKGGDKPKILLLGGQHAREWIAPATVMYIANKLATEYGKDSVVTNLLDTFDIVLVPVLNADGYTYTWTSSNARLWRKNRRVNADKSYGVDLNRNWGFHWCESGASKMPSSDTYCGTSAFSEPETQAIANISKAYGPFKGAIDFHSYGQLLMRPFGYTSSPPPNNDELTRIGEGMKDIMKATTGVEYTNQAIWQLYLSAGSSADYWVSIGINYAYGFEARDLGKNGFLLPPDQIVPSGEENFAAVNYLASQVKDK